VPCPPGSHPDPLPRAGQSHRWGESAPEHTEIIGNIYIDPDLADGSNALIPDLEVPLHPDDQGDTDVRLAWQSPHDLALSMLERMS
jgi:hypothetical protein